MAATCCHSLKQVWTSVVWNVSEAPVWRVHRVNRPVVQYYWLKGQANVHYTVTPFLLVAAVSFCLTVSEPRQNSTGI